MGIKERFSKRRAQAWKLPPLQEVMEVNQGLLDLDIQNKIPRDEGYPDVEQIEQAIPTEEEWQQAYDQNAAVFDPNEFFDEDGEWYAGEPVNINEIFVSNVVADALMEAALREQAARINESDRYFEKVRNHIRSVLESAKNSGKIADWEEDIAGTGSTYYSVGLFVGYDEDGDPETESPDKVIRLADHTGDLRGVDRHGREAFLILTTDENADVDANLPVGSSDEQISKVAKLAVDWLVRED